MNYKTQFIDAPTVKIKGVFNTSLDEVNGDQLARDVDAAILEKAGEGYELVSVSPVTSSKIYMSSYSYSLTTGILLIFKKKEE